MSDDGWTWPSTSRLRGGDEAVATARLLAALGTGRFLDAATAPF
ncbi:hypothetical protein [Streptomyces sp. CAU 1734]